MKYRNIGAPFTRDDGTVWERDMVAVPIDDELARRRYKLRAVAEGVEPLPSPPPVAGGPSPWTLKMKPERYLSLHPDGPHAAHACELVAAAEQQSQEEATSEPIEEERVDGHSDE